MLRKLSMVFVNLIFHQISKPRMIILMMRRTQWDKICYFIIWMVFIIMMNMNNQLFSAYTTFMFMISKSYCRVVFSFVVHPIIFTWTKICIWAFIWACCLRPCASTNFKWLFAYRTYVNYKIFLFIVFLQYIFIKTKLFNFHLNKILGCSIVWNTKIFLYVMFWNRNIKCSFKLLIRNFVSQVHIFIYSNLLDLG